MKMLISALLAASAVSLAAPAAMAQPYRDGGYAQRHWDRGDAYGSRGFEQNYRQVQAQIRDGRRDGVFSPDQARMWSNALQAIGDRADWMRRNGNYDARDLNGRLDQLRYRIDRGYQATADQQDRQYGYNDRGYGRRR